ncbi:MAG: hypothetical protein HFH24_12465 [Ruminococcus sp.]|nr:hypothetical protein [Ruminococcus sp.]
MLTGPEYQELLELRRLVQEQEQKIEHQSHQLRRLYKVGRSSLSFELPLSFEWAAAYRKANGQYIRKNQWRETNVTVYIDLD